MQKDIQWKLSLSPTQILYPPLRVILVTINEALSMKFLWIYEQKHLHLRIYIVF